MTLRLRPLLVNLGVLCGTLMLLIVLGEIFLRLANIQPMTEPKVRIHRPSAIPGVVYEFIPDTTTRGFGRERIAINALGFRGQLPDPAKPLIAVVGDSFAFGYGVGEDEANPAVLARLLPRASVLNTAVNGYNIEQEALVFRERVAPLRPALVIVQFVFNDMDPKGYFDMDGFIRVGKLTEEENLRRNREAITRPGLINFPGKVFFQEHSAIFNFVERHTKWLPFRRRTPLIFEDPITSEQLAFYEKWLSVLVQASPQSKKLFVIWPEQNLHLESRAVLTRMAKAQGFSVLDLYDVFGDGYKTLLWDYHPNAATQRRAAELITQAIDPFNLLPLTP